MTSKHSGQRTKAQQERLAQLRQAWLEPEFQEEVRYEFPYAELADAVIGLRSEYGLTQAELAQRAGTTQSVIARLESGRHAVQINLLNRVAGALGLTWRPVFAEPAAMADVLAPDETAAIAEVGEVIDFDTFRRPRAVWQSGMVAAPSRGAAAEGQVTMTVPELRAALSRFVDSFSRHAVEDEDEHRVAEPSGEYTAV